MNSYLHIFQSVVRLAESYTTENRIETSVSKLLHLTSDLLNTWTSNFVVPHGDQSIELKGLYLLLHYLAYSHTKLCHFPVQSIILTIIFFLVWTIRIYS